MMLRVPFLTFLVCMMWIGGSVSAFGQASSGAGGGARSTGNLDTLMIQNEISVKAGQQGGSLLPKDSLVDCSELSNQNQRKPGVAHLPKSLLEDEFSVQASSSKIIQGNVFVQGCSN